MMTRLTLYMAVLVALASPAVAQSSLPDPRLTPGATNPDVTQENIGETICVRGWTRTIRPPQQYTNALKLQQIRQYYGTGRTADFEEDHLIPLTIGGHPTAPENLWPEPMIAADTWRADDKDLLERVLNNLVCQRRLSLAAAQRAIATNWKTAYTVYVTGE